MSVVSLINVTNLTNPAKFGDKFQFEITFECLEPLTKDLEWKLTYVGSATSSDHDQVLDSMLVGPVPVGVNKFVFEADAPNPNSIPSSEILGVTVILLTASYDEREFIRVGYYVNNEYDNPEMNEEPPKTVQPDRLVRNVLAEKPRVTRFAIKWDSEESAPAEFPPDQPDADLQEADGDQYGAEEGEPEESEVEGEAEGEVAAPDPDAMEEDTEMGGIEHPPAEPAGDESEDLEESSEEEYDEEEEGEEGEGEEMEEATHDEAMATDAAAPGGPDQKPPVHEAIAQH